MLAISSSQNSLATGLEKDKQMYPGRRFGQHLFHVNCIVFGKQLMYFRIAQAQVTLGNGQWTRLAIGEDVGMPWRQSQRDSQSLNKIALRTCATSMNIDARGDIYPPFL